MTKTTWEQVFAPVAAKSTKALEPRPQQEALGNAIIEAFESKHNLVAQALVGTGKSFAILVPMIHQILEAKKEKKQLRGVISTETISLQDQYCLAPGTRILTADLRHVPVESLTVGDELTAFDEERVDGRRRFKKSVVLSTEIIERPCYEVTFSDGTSVVSSSEHRWLTMSGSKVKWMTTESLLPVQGKRGASSVIKLSDVWDNASTVEEGYLAEILDGEGHIHQNVSLSAGGQVNKVSFSQVPGVVLDSSLNELDRAGIAYRTYLNVVDIPDRKDYVTVNISTRKDMIKVLGKYRPQRLLDVFNPDLLGTIPAVTGRNKNVVRVVSKTFLGTQKVVAVQTSTKTLIAEGLASHNCNKDLPFLESVYPGFTFKTLKGRSNYMCFSNAKIMARGNQKVAGLMNTLDRQRGRIVTGERTEIEKIIGYELDDHTWSFLAGQSANCSEHGADPENCYCDKARAAALAADIVVVNHALLRVDAESREDDTFNADNFLGPIDFLAVDEAHTLEQVLISGWTEELAEWELLEKTTKIHDAVDFAKSFVNDVAIGYRTQQANDSVSEYLKSVTRFFELRNKDQEWRQVTDTISLKYVTGGDSRMINAMNAYEVEGLAGLEFAVKVYGEVLDHIKLALEELDAVGGKGKRKLSKGRTAALELTRILNRIIAAMNTKDGTFVEYGVPFVVTASGIERRNGDHSVRLSVVPLDISAKAQAIWQGRTCVIMSGTLMDLTDGSFRYATTSLGFKDYKEISTDSPFEHQAQQLVYVTPALKQKVELKGAQFSMDELIDLITAARGRSLVLFTSRAELDYAASYVRELAASGQFPWKLLVQDKDANKALLTDAFGSDIHSVLFATKSFFTGNDFPGETVSLVVLAKFPLPQFNVVCRQQISWWRGRGFPQWYEREALAVFHQAAGRLIRTKSDTGVVALLDQRVTDISERVCQTALIGVKGLGSPVTQSIEDIKRFIS